VATWLVGRRTSISNLEDGDERPVQGVEVLAMTDALVGQNLGARADVVIVDVSTKLAAEQVHSEHAAHAPQHSGTRRETANKVSARGRRDDMPPQMEVRRWQKSRRIYVRPRTGPQSAHLRWPAVAKLQAASVPTA